MTLDTLVPTDTTPSLKWAPTAQTCRVFDRNIYNNDTAFTVAPVMTPVGLPVRVVPDEVSVYGRAYNSVLLDPTGLSATLAGIWYADVMVALDPDVIPTNVYVMATHPDWVAPETRMIPAGTTRAVWTSLELVVLPTPPVLAVFVGAGGGGGGNVDGGLIIGGGGTDGTDGGGI